VGDIEGTLRMMVLASSFSLYDQFSKKRRVDVVALVGFRLFASVIYVCIGWICSIAGDGFLLLLGRAIARVLLLA